MRPVLVFVAVAVLVAAVSMAQEPPGMDPVSWAATQYFTLQSAKNCSGFVSLFAPSFSVIDPRGSVPITSRGDLLQDCLGGAQFFPVIEMAPVQISVVPTNFSCAVAFHVTSVVNATTGCSLDFYGIDTFVVDPATYLIMEVVGYYNVSIPNDQVAACQSS